MLNDRVFFWLTEQRLDQLLAARAYRQQRHTILTIETSSLLALCGERVHLSPINSGSTVYNPQPRGLSTFLRLGEYPFDEWRSKRGPRKAAAEWTVVREVTPISGVVLRVEERGNERRARLIWER